MTQNGKLRMTKIYLTVQDFNKPSDIILNGESILDTHSRTGQKKLTDIIKRKE